MSGPRKIPCSSLTTIPSPLASLESASSEKETLTVRFFLGVDFLLRRVIDEGGGFDGDGDGGATTTTIGLVGGSSPSASSSSFVVFELMGVAWGGDDDDDVSTLQRANCGIFGDSGAIAGMKRRGGRSGIGGLSSIEYRSKTRGVRLTGLSPFWEKVWIVHTLHFPFL